MKKYKDSGAADEFKQKKKLADKEKKAAEKKSKAPSPKKSKNTSVGSGSGKFTSKEYIEDDDSSSDSAGGKKKDSKEVGFCWNNFINLTQGHIWFRVCYIPTYYLTTLYNYQ